MWVGDTIYFVSDRNHTANLFSYKAGAKQVTQLTKHEDFDIMNASAAPTPSFTNRPDIFILLT
jgi:tricorn protease